MLLQAWIKKMASLFGKPKVNIEQEEQKEAISITNIVEQMNGVIAVENCVLQNQGHFQVVTLTILVNPSISVQEGHLIARSVRWQLMQSMTHLSNVIVHVKPFSTEQPYSMQQAGQSNSSMLLQ